MRLRPGGWSSSSSRPPSAVPITRRPSCTARPGTAPPSSGRAACTIDGRPFKVWAARPLEGGAVPGLAVHEGRLVMGTAEGGLELLELQPPGRNRMPAATFLRGYRGPLELGEAA